MFFLPFFTTNNFLFFSLELQRVPGKDFFFFDSLPSLERRDLQNCPHNASVHLTAIDLPLYDDQWRQPRARDG